MNISTLKNRFAYNSETGDIFYKENCGSKAVKGSKAGTIQRVGNDKQYIVVKVNEVRIHAHYLAWILFYEEIPTETVSHHNHNGLDNRIKNLYQCTFQQAHKNRRRRKDNASGCSGVRWVEPNKKWRAEIAVYEEGKTSKHLGYFADFLDAVSARKSAEVRYGYHENNGLTKGCSVL